MLFIKEQRVKQWNNINNENLTEATQNWFHNFQVIRIEGFWWMKTELMIFTLGDEREKKRWKTPHGFHYNRLLTEITMDFALRFGPSSSMMRLASAQNIRTKPMIEFWFTISLIFILHIKYLFIRFHISWRIKFILQNLWGWLRHGALFA